LAKWTLGLRFLNLSAKNKATTFVVAYLVVARGFANYQLRFDKEISKFEICVNFEISKCKDLRFASLRKFKIL